VRYEVFSRDIEADGMHTYQWDAEERVASVDSGSTWSFTYNALGHRLQWAAPGGGETRLYDPEGNFRG
jgi:YD repeat-containing protein